MLSRAIEADSSSLVLWIVYLHVYYGKEKNIGKDDMFFNAVSCGLNFILDHDALFLFLFTLVSDKFHKLTTPGL